MADCGQMVVSYRKLVFKVDLYLEGRRGIKMKLAVNHLEQHHGTLINHFGVSGQLEILPLLSTYCKF